MYEIAVVFWIKKHSVTEESGGSAFGVGAGRVKTGIRGMLEACNGAGRRNQLISPALAVAAHIGWLNNDIKVFDSHAIEGCELRMQIGTYIVFQVLQTG
ncbi:hypothetical protein [Paenibacillus sp. NPDC055715]